MTFTVKRADMPKSTFTNLTNELRRVHGDVREDQYEILRKAFIKEIYEEHRMSVVKDDDGYVQQFIFESEADYAYYRLRWE